MENIYVLIVTFFFLLQVTEKSTESGFNKLEKGDSR